MAIVRAGNGCGQVRNGTWASRQYRKKGWQYSTEKRPAVRQYSIGRKACRGKPVVKVWRLPPQPRCPSLVASLVVPLSLLVQVSCWCSIMPLSPLPPQSASCQSTSLHPTYLPTTCPTPHSYICHPPSPHLPVPQPPPPHLSGPPDGPSAVLYPTPAERGGPASRAPPRPPAPGRP